MEKYKSLKNRMNVNIEMYLIGAGRLKYILAIPETLKDNAELFVETYNSGGKQRKSYGENIQDAISENANNIRRRIIETVTDFPVVMPIMPDIEDFPDFQQLSLESVRDYKMHEKTFECIEDAKKKIKEITGKSVQEKIFLNGYSASGVFAQRFALIYPEIVGRCMIGGAAGTIPVPTNRIKYPIGIEDYKELFGKDFDLESYKKIIFGYYVSEKEEKESAEWGLDGEMCRDDDEKVRAPMHDMSFRTITTPRDVGIIQRYNFGQTMNARYRNTIEANKKLGIDIEGIILKDADHQHIFDSKYTPTTRDLIAQLRDFYKNNIQLNPNGRGCCSGLDLSFQKARYENSQDRYR